MGIWRTGRIWARTGRGITRGARTRRTKARPERWTKRIRTKIRTGDKNKGKHVLCDKIAFGSSCFCSSYSCPKYVPMYVPNVTVLFGEFYTKYQ